MSTGVLNSSIQEVADLSFTQMSILFQHLRKAKEQELVAQAVYEIEGPLNVETFRESVMNVVANNPVLRSVFSWENVSKPLRVVSKDIFANIHFEDMSGGQSGAIDTIIDAYLEADRAQPFQLEKAAIRFGIIKRSELSHLVYITRHTILFDHESLDLLTKQVFTNYDLLLNNKSLSITPKPVGKDRRKTSGPVVADPADHQFWRDVLEGYQMVGLKLDGFGGEEKNSLEKLKVSSHVDVSDFASRHNVRVASIIYAAYGLLLQRYLNISDVVFGVAVSGRQNEKRGHSKTIGNFMNVYPVRLKDNHEQSLLEVVCSMDHYFDSLAGKNPPSHSDIRQINEFGPTDDLFDSVITVNRPRKKLQLQTGSYQVQLLSEVEHTDVPLSISVTINDRLEIDFAYNTEHLPVEMMNKLSTHFLRIVEEIIGRPDRRSADVDFLTDEEQHKFTHEFNNTASEYPTDKSIIELFEAQVQKTPGKCAVFGASTSITYEHLSKEINGMAAWLQRYGVCGGDVVGICMDRSIDFIINALAVIKAGALYLPLDAKYPEARVDFILQDSKARLLITKTDFVRGKDLQGPYTVVCYDELRVAEDEGPVGASAVNDNIYIIYTSGSTGLPKGVKGSQNGLLNRLHWGWNNYPAKDGEIFCFKTNVAFVDHVVEIFSPLLTGVPVRVFTDDEVLDVKRMCSLLIDERITRITVVPTYLNALVDLRSRAGLANHSLRYVFCSGENLSFQLAREFYREFSGAALINIYGSTEVSADATFYNVDRFYVEDVLKYFKKTNYGLDSDITAPEVRIEDIASNFHNFRISDYPTSIEEYYEDLERNVLPYSINTASPKFVGHMTSVLPDYVHDISKLLSQLNQNLVKIETSKSFTFIEREVIAMLHRIFYEYSDTFYDTNIQRLNSNLGVITTGGSTANMTALLSARNKLLYENSADHLAGESIYQLLKIKGYNDMVILGSPLMHYSFRKTASVLGLGTKNILYVDNDSTGRIDLHDLEAKIKYCKDNGLLIIAMVGIAGSTETGSIDPLRKMGEIARTNGIHFHVDAAWGGLVKFSDEYSALVDGIDLADSITFCGHKQLFLPQGISVCLFKDPSQLNYNSTVANYQAASNSFDFGRVTLEGSKSGLSLCLHASLKVMGKKGYELLLDRGIKLAQSFAAIIRSTSCLELISININIINYRYIPVAYRNKPLTPEDDEIINEWNSRIQETQFLKGKTFVSKTKIKLNGRYTTVFRAVLSNPLTSRQDLESVVKDQFAIIEELFGEQNLVEFVCTESEDLSSRVAAVDEEVRRIPIGKPISNSKAFILNTHLQQQPIGVPGELFISGAGVSGGYVNDAELTGRRFVANPFEPGTTMYGTGDLARWLPDGNIEFLGRLDDQVKIKGYRVELTEIESRITSCKGIKQSIVVEKKKEGKKYLVAYYVSDIAISSLELHCHLARHLPDYMLPVHYIHMDVFPLTPGGKVYRKNLPDPMLVSAGDYNDSFGGDADEELPFYTVSGWM